MKILINLLITKDSRLFTFLCKSKKRKQVVDLQPWPNLAGRGRRGLLSPPRPPFLPYFLQRWYSYVRAKSKKRIYATTKKGVRGILQLGGIDHGKSYKCSHSSSSWKAYGEVYRDREELPKEERT